MYLQDISMYIDTSSVHQLRPLSKFLKSTSSCLSSRRASHHLQAHRQCHAYSGYHCLDTLVRGPLKVMAPSLPGVEPTSKPSLYDVDHLSVHRQIAELLKERAILLNNLQSQAPTTAATFKSSNNTTCDITTYFM